MEKSYCDCCKREMEGVCRVEYTVDDPENEMAFNATMFVCPECMRCSPGEPCLINPKED